jgi:hypothetical protein
MTCFAKGRHRPCYGRLTVHHIVSQPGSGESTQASQRPTGAARDPVPGR